MWSTLAGQALPSLQLQTLELAADILLYFILTDPQHPCQPIVGWDSAVVHQTPFVACPAYRLPALAVGLHDPGFGSTNCRQGAVQPLEGFESWAGRKV